MNYSYNNILKTANKFYLSASEAKILSSVHYLNEYFKEATLINPCVAKMALQQAQMDVFEIINNDYADDEIDAITHKDNTEILFKTGLVAENDARMAKINKSIKAMYPKTGKKRLALIPCILDTYEYGLASVSPPKGMEALNSLVYKFAKAVVMKINPSIIGIEEQIFEDKFAKKLNFLRQRLLK